MIEISKLPCAIKLITETRKYFPKRSIYEKRMSEFLYNNDKSKNSENTTCACAVKIPNTPMER